MNFASITSGSSGNCIYVGANNTHLLVDAGISGKKIKEGLLNFDIKPEDINGILVTHEHSDHIAGIGVMARKYGTPIYATKGTIKGILESKVGVIPEGLFNEIKSDESFEINELKVNPVKISHDANEPVAYRVYENNSSVGICTDLGKYDDYIVESFKGVNALLLEANHDVNMLQVGSYPYYLKQRILGDRGHLSNENSGRLLSRLLHDDLKAVMLGHLSQENNLEELAYEAVRLEILMADNVYKPDDFEINVASRFETSRLIAV